MMINSLYSMIFRRKSFHLFLNVGSEQIKNHELEALKKEYDSFEKLYPEIKTAIRIVPASKVNFKRDAEYCILIYSEKKENYLMNTGYIGEQMDLYLVSQNIGTLWFGIGKPDEPTFEGLDYVVMLAVHKINNESLFRKDMFKAKRKPLEDIWEGDTLGVAEIARFAPSACNSQPWFVRNTGNVIEVNRYRKPGKIGIMSAKTAAYFNRIDIGIYLCILEICMAEQNISAKRELYADCEDYEYSLVARYYLK